MGEELLKADSVVISHGLMFETSPCDGGTGSSPVVRALS